MLRKKVLVSGLTLVVVTSLLSGPAQANQKIGARDASQGAVAAASKKIANRPSVVAVTASKARSKRVNITVTLQLGSTIRGAAPTGSEVRIGRNICRISKAKRKCTVRNVSINSRLRISARTQNKSGFSKWSKAVSFRATSGKRWSRRPTVPTKDTPTVPTKDTPTVPTKDTPTVPTKDTLKFNIKNAVGLTLKNSVSGTSVRKATAGSNLQAVDSAGNTTDAVTSGSAAISRFMIAPNDKLYVVFSFNTIIGTRSCILAEVAKSTGEPMCIESDLASISWPDGSTSFVFEPIQFDDSGAIYYSGTDSAGKAVLRRYRDGASTSLISDNVSSLRFSTLPDGRVIIGGSTMSSNNSWTRLVTLTGGLQSLVAGSFPQFMSTFPDGNVYMGFWNNDEMGVKRFLSSLGTMDSTYWISGNTNGIPRNSFYDVDANRSTSERITALEGNYGTWIRQLVSTSDKKVYAITGQIPTLVQYYPQVTKPSTAVTSVNVMQRVLSYIILSGTNADGQNVTTIYNSATNSEEMLIPSSNEIEIYRLNYVASSNKIMFDGLRFSDNKYVLGQIDMATGQVTASQTGSSKLIDFQTFTS